MRKIVYYVASTIDGYIAGKGGNVSDFVYDGNGVQQYLEDLKTFDTVVMGRKTYEFAYKFGLKPGEAPYPHMQHYIFSNHLVLENRAENVHVCKFDPEEIITIRNKPGNDIYFCGGGQMAAWMLENQLIDFLKIKLNPVVLGGGIRIFGESTETVKFDLLEAKSYEKSLQILTYNVVYA